MRRYGQSMTRRVLALEVGITISLSMRETGDTGRRRLGGGLIAPRHPQNARVDSLNEDQKASTERLWY
jgi:hypothetical protein